MNKTSKAEGEWYTETRKEKVKELLDALMTVPDMELTDRGYRM